MTNVTKAQIQMVLASQAPSGHPMRDVQVKIRRKETVKRKQPEQELQEAVCRYLDTQSHILYWANNPQIITGKMTPQKLGYLAKMKKRGFKKGVPDLCLLVNSKLVLIELKAEKGVVSDEQKEFLQQAYKRGAFSAIVRNLEDLISFVGFIEQTMKKPE